MNFSFKKYIGVFLVVFLSTVLCVPLTILAENQIEVVIDSSDDVIPVEEVIDNPNQTVSVPKFTKAIPAWNYGMDLLLNGDGYKISANTTASASVMGVSASQYIYYTVDHSGDKHYEYSVAYCANPLGRSFARKIYYDNGSVKVNETTNLTKIQNPLIMKEIVPVFKNDTVQSMTYADFCSNVCTVGIDNFPFDISESTTTQLSFDASSSKDYYIFSIKLKDSAIPKDYSTNIKKNANASNLVFNDVTFECYMSKRTGCMLKMIKTEAYDMTVSIATLNVSSKTNYNLTSNVAMDIPDPFI